MKKSKLTPVPFWATDTHVPYPCPCGEPMDENYVISRGEKGLLRLFHPECLGEFLELGEGDEDSIH